MNRTGISCNARLTVFSAVATQLAMLSDRKLEDLVSKSSPINSGIGGTTFLLQVAGTPIFAKKIPLTDLERQSEHVMSTANIFQLPMFCHYGVGLVGSPGFGVWRELAVHIMTTNWVLAKQIGSITALFSPSSSTPSPKTRQPGESAQRTGDQETGSGVFRV